MLLVMLKKPKHNARPVVIAAAGLSIFLLLSCCMNAFAEEPEYKVKAEFIERFTRFIDWPADSNVVSSSTPFVICVIGDNPFGNYLQELAKTRKIKNRTIEVQIVTDFQRVKDCDLLFISRSEKDRLHEILAQTEGKPILTIGDTVGYAKDGVLINFYQEETNIRFEVNADAIQKSNLKFNARLLKLARIVDSSKHEAL